MHSLLATQWSQIRHYALKARHCFFAYEVIGICSFIWFSSRLQTGNKNGRLWVVLSLVTLLMITAMRGERLEFIIALLPLLLVAWASVCVRPSHHIPALLLGACIVSAFASFRQGELPTVASLVFNIFSDGLYAGHVTPNVLEAAQQGSIEAEYGLRYLAAIALIFPRFFFTEKDAIVYGSLNDIGQFSPLGATSILAEAFLQSGMLAEMVWFLIVGMLAGRLEISGISRENRGIPVKFILYIIFVCSFIPHFRDGLIPAIKIPLQLLIVSAIVIGRQVGVLD